jgi:hypothetical protein
MWKATAYRAQLAPGVDGRLVVTLGLFALHLSWSMLGLFLANLVFFVILERRGYTLETCLLAIRGVMLGGVRTRGDARSERLRMGPKSYFD